MLLLMIRNYKKILCKGWYKALDSLRVAGHKRASTYKYEGQYIDNKNFGNEYTLLATLTSYIHYNFLECYSVKLTDLKVFPQIRPLFYSNKFCSTIILVLL